MSNNEQNKVTPPLGWLEVDLENYQFDNLEKINSSQIDELLENERRLFKENYQNYNLSSDTFTTGDYINITVEEMKNKQKIVKQILDNVIKEDKVKNGKWWALAYTRVTELNSHNKDPFVEMVSNPGGPVPPTEAIKMQADANLTLSNSLGLEDFNGKVIDKGSFSLISFILWLFPFGILFAITLCTLILGGIKS